MRLVGSAYLLTYSDGTEVEITNYQYSETVTDEFKIFCIDGGAYILINLAIIDDPVEPDEPTIPELLIDFEYTDNNDGTYTLTGWKQTYNGASSTEMVVPDVPGIIL